MSPRKGEEDGGCELELVDEEVRVDKPLLPLGEKEKEEKEGSLATAQWRRLLSLAQPEWLILCVGIVALLCTSVIAMAIPAAAGVIINNVIGEAPTSVCSRSVTC